jgi:cytoskeletal protein RodZ
MRFIFHRFDSDSARTYSASGKIFLPVLARTFLSRGLRHPPKSRNGPNEMAKGTFGERLKRERELREVTVDELCNATRIAPRFLDALENEHWEKLPGGVFGRGFVRTIARYLGLSEENLLSEYDLARGETAAIAVQKPEERIPSTPKWIPAVALILLMVILLGIVLGGRYAWRKYAARRAAAKASAMVTSPDQTASATHQLGGTAQNATAHLLSLELATAIAAPLHVKVVADGTTLFDGDVTAGEKLHFSANEKFVISTSGLRALLLQLNGQPVTLTSASSSSGTILLTSKDLRPIAGATAHP